MATVICERCGLRPAWRRSRRVRPGVGEETQRLCEVRLAEVSAAASPRGFGGRGPVRRLLLRLLRARRLAGQPASRRRHADRAAPAVSSRSTSPSTSATPLASCSSARPSRRWSGAASTSTPSTCCGRRCRTTSWPTCCASSTPTRRRSPRRSRKRPSTSERTDVAPSLSPEAKGALLAAYREIARARRLLRRARARAARAGRATRSPRRGGCSRRFGLSHTKLRGAVIRGVEEGEGAGRPASQTKTLDQYGRDLTQAAREGKLDPVIGRADEIEQTIEILSRRTKNNPVLIGDPGRRQDGDRRGHRPAHRQRRGAGDAGGQARWWGSTWPAMVAGTKYRGEFEER